MWVVRFVSLDNEAKCYITKSEALARAYELYRREYLGCWAEVIPLGEAVQGFEAIKNIIEEDIFDNGLESTNPELAERIRKLLEIARKMEISEVVI